MYSRPLPLSLKPLRFLGSSLDDLRNFPRVVKHAAGIELMRVQAGVEPANFKPLREVGDGAYEIRLRLAGAWRVIYVARFDDAIYVLHAFQKKTQKTAPRDIKRAAARYRTLLKRSEAER